MGVIRHMLDKIVPSRRRRWWVKCGDAFPVLSEFMDSELDPEMMARMQRHVEDCPPCRNLFRSLEKTKDLCREVPQDFAQDLMATIRREYKEAKRHLGAPPPD
ncbi:MAG: zf-HC2 domain-containing protein [Nitrospinota bacterium]|nr:zf-HC2 domain-containing protein [Nitrospinota bacterium]